MIICRKCQTQHADDSVACSCGADLSRDGIAIVTRPNVGPSPATDLPPLDHLEPIDEEPPAAPQAEPKPSLAARSDRATPPGATDQPQSNRTGATPSAAPGQSSAAPIPGPAIVSSDPRVVPGPSAIAPPLDTTAEPPAVTPPDVAGRRGVRPDDAADTDTSEDANVGVPLSNAFGDDQGPSPLATTVTAQPPRQAKAGEVSCSSCYEPNDEQRRFCLNCGNLLPAFHAGDDDFEEVFVPKDTAWRRLTGTGMRNGRDERTWAQRTKDQQIRKIKYQAGYSLKAKLAAVGLTGAMLGGGMGAVGPWRRTITEWFNRPPDGAVPAAVVATQSDPLPGFEAASARDENPDTGVGLRWTNTEADQAGAGDGVQPDVVLEFQDAMNPTAIDIAGGLAAGDNAPLVLRPATVAVCADPNEPNACQQFELKDETGLQRLKLNKSEVAVESVRIRVMSVHDRKYTTYPIVVINEFRVVD